MKTRTPQLGECQMLNTNTHVWTYMSRTVIVRCGAAALALGSMNPLTAEAQISGEGLGKALGEALGKMVVKGIQDMAKIKVIVTPTVTIVDSISRTATLTFLNPTRDTLETRISAGVTSPAGTFKGAKSASEKKTSPLLDETQDSTSLQPTLDSIQADQSLASWIVDLPSTLKLAPGEERTITVKLNVPADAKPGEYSAWVVTSTVAQLKLGSDASGQSNIQIQGDIKDQNGSAAGMVNQTGAKLIYRHRVSQ